MNTNTTPLGEEFNLLIQERIKNFWGYGNLNSPYWFIGMEEGYSEVNETLLDRFTATAHQQVCDIYDDLKVDPGHVYWFEDGAPIQRTWRRLIEMRVTTHETDLNDTFKEIELIKFQSLSEKLTLMLEQPNAYNEKQWQTEILDIILLLFPKYVYAFENAVVKDDYRGEDRKLDLILVDAEGHVDVIEIKKPFGDAVVSSGKYRDNYVPKRELSGSIVQLEKYIFHLSKSGKKGEQKLTEQFKRKLPADFEIKITNPSGLVIVGRSNNLNTKQKADFEVIKKKYKNLLDIITYDDLLERLRRIIESWKKR